MSVNSKGRCVQKSWILLKSNSDHYAPYKMTVCADQNCIPHRCQTRCKSLSQNTIQQVCSSPQFLMLVSLMFKQKTQLPFLKFCFILSCITAPHIRMSLNSMKDRKVLGSLLKISSKFMKVVNAENVVKMSVKIEVFEYLQLNP